MGAEVIKGTFTAPHTDSTDSYTLDFGKSFSSYLFLIEMTDASKATLMATGDTKNRAFSFVGVYPKRSISSIVATNNVLITRVNASANTSDTVANYISRISDSSISINVYSLSLTGAYYLYPDYSYNYTIVSLDNI